MASAELTHAAPALAVTALVTVAFAASVYRRPAPPLWIALAVGAVTRVVFAAITSHRYTPNDSRTFFRQTGVLVSHGKDPLQHLPGRQWNFLELMPYVHALELKTGLAWVYALKIAPILADLVLVWLVSLVAGADGRARALQYALNPLSLFVVSLHGQVEPVALAFALGGVLLARRERWGWAGVLLGTAVAIKTWPVIVAAAVAPWPRARRLGEFLAAGAVVPVVSLLSGVAFLDTAPWRDVKHVLSYSSFVGRWGWPMVLRDFGVSGLDGYKSSVGHLGSAITALAVAVTVILLRNRPPEARALAALAAALVVTAGFGTQYLLWVAPLAVALCSPGVLLGFVAAATAYAAMFYLAVPVNPQGEMYLAGLSWLVIVTIARIPLRLWAENDQIPAAGSR